MTKSTKPLKVKIRRLPHADGLPLPAYQTADAAGMDLVAAIPASEPVIIASGARAMVPTGLTFELPRGTEAQVRPRSGLAAKNGVTVLNSPGTIDADYRGEVSVILINHGDAAFTIQRGDRIAQMILAPVTQVRLVEVSTLTKTSRGAGGFGSTGVAPAGALKSKPIAPQRKSAKPGSKKASSRTSKVPSQR
jgi:dUTP pyrophosphatase